MIRKLSSGGYRLYSRKANPKTGRRRNLGTFSTPGGCRAARASGAVLQAGELSAPCSSRRMKRRRTEGAEEHATARADAGFAGSSRHPTPWTCRPGSSLGGPAASPWVA